MSDGTDFPDEVGTVLPDLEAARREAVLLAGRLLTDNPDQFWNGEGWSVEVSDERRMVLFAVYFYAADAPALRGARRTG